jgi:hypothetical protein
MAAPAAATVDEARAAAAGLKGRDARHAAYHVKVRERERRREREREREWAGMREDGERIGDRRRVRETEKERQGETKKVE